MYDIIVIGAGPAGSMAAKSAALKGKKVCLIERKATAGAPVRCGEGIGRKGLELSLEPKSTWIKTVLSKSVMISPSNISVTISDVDESYILDRELMDNDLADEAKKAGADYITSTPVLSIKKDGAIYNCICPSTSFQSRCIIIADGVESRLARDLGWNTTLALRDIETCAFARVVSPLIERDTCYFYTGSTIAPGGYAWVFPRAKGEANVGLGIIGHRSSAGKPLELLNQFINREFPGARILQTHCGGVPVSKWIRPLVKDGAMLVGDAARQVNCLNGAGIAYSLYAGKLAGTIAADSLSKDQCDYKQLKKYETTWKKTFGKQQDRSYHLKEFLLTTDDAFLDRIAASLSKEKPNKMNYLRVFARVFKGHPLLLLKALKLLA